MAKIDVSTIEGFADMTAEQKAEALANYEFPDPDYTGYVKKDVFDKTASELASWKKKHNELLSEEERKKLENEQMFEEMKNKLAGLEKEKTVSSYKASFAAQGYPEPLATEAATAMANGEMDKVFAAQKTFLEQYEKDVKAKVLKETPKPPAGGKGGEMTKADFLKLDTKAQLEFIKTLWLPISVSRLTLSCLTTTGQTQKTPL